jgi:hypothetical protein
MAISGVSSSEPIISELQAIHATINDSYDNASRFYKFIKNYNNAAGIRSFSAFLNEALKHIDSNYHPFDQNHEFNIAIKALGDNPHLLGALFNQDKYKSVKRLYKQNIVLLKKLDISYQNFLNLSIPLQPPQIIAPMYSHQSSQKQIADFVVNDEYIRSLYSDKNTFQQLGEQQREHFLAALLHLRKSTSCHLATLLGCQDNEDLNCFLDFIDHKLQLPSADQHYGDIAEVAKTTLQLRRSSDTEFINDECRLYRESGLSYFETKRVPPRPMF